MEWTEINCLIAALEALIEKYQAALQDQTLSEDDHADVSNDLAYAEILHGKYDALRTKIANG